MRISTRPNKDHDFRGTLAALFTDIFAPDELRRFIHSLPNGNHLSCALPGSEASMFSLSDAAERLLVRHGLVDAHLFHQLAILRPVRADAIFALGHLACPSTPADAQANAAAPPPTEHRLRATEVFPLHDLLLGAVSPTTSPLELTWMDIFGVTRTNAPPTKAESPNQRLLVSFQKGRRLRFATIEFGRDESPRDVIIRPSGAVPSHVVAHLSRDKLRVGPLLYLESDDGPGASPHWDLLNRSSDNERAPLGWYVGLPSILFNWAQGTLQEVISRGDLDTWTLDHRYLLMRRLLDGVLSLHSNGLLHGDLRPANIMFMSRRDEPTDYKIADYGSLATGKPDMLGGTSDNSGRTVLQAIHNARASAFYAPERRNGFEHEEADTAIITRASDNKRWIILLGWRSTFEELRRTASHAAGGDASRRSDLAPNALAEVLRRMRAAFADHASTARPRAATEPREESTATPQSSDIAGRALLEPGDRIRLREMVLQVASVATVRPIQNCTVLLCESTIWKVFNERLIVQDDDFERDFAQATCDTDYIELSLPKVVELYQWSQATDIYSLGVLLLYLCFPRAADRDPSRRVHGVAIDRAIEQEFLVLLDQWANPLYFNQLWTQLQLITTQIIDHHKEMTADGTSSPRMFRDRVLDVAIAGRIFAQKVGEADRTLYKAVLQVVNNICETSPHARRVLEHTFGWNVGHFVLFVHFIFACLHRQEDLRLAVAVKQMRGSGSPDDEDFDGIKAQLATAHFPFAPGRIDRPPGAAPSTTTAAARALRRMTELLDLCTSVYLRQMTATNGEGDIADYRPRSQAETLLDNTRLNLDNQRLHGRVRALENDYETLSATSISRVRHEQTVADLERTLHNVREVHRIFSQEIGARLELVRLHRFTALQRALGADVVRARILTLLQTSTRYAETPST